MSVVVVMEHVEELFQMVALALMLTFILLYFILVYSIQIYKSISKNIKKLPSSFSLPPIMN